MYKKISCEESVQKALKYIGQNYYHCPFLYTNLKKYGIANENIELYLGMQNNEICYIAYKYYNCLHVYSNEEDENIDGLYDLIKRINPQKLFWPKFHKQNSEQLIDMGYSFNETLVMAPQYFLDIDVSKVKKATIDDLMPIAKFMCTEWADSYSSVDDLYNQLKERMIDSFGRTKYLEENGEIIACVSSYAELDDFSVCGGLLISNSQRGKKLGSIMLKSLYEELDKEGRHPCGLIVADYSRVFHEKNGFKVMGKILQYYK